MEKKEQLEEFRKYLIEKERAGNTIESYMKAVTDYYEKFHSVTLENMIAYKQTKLAENSPKTAQLRCVAMNQFCEFLGKPECKVKRIKIQKRNSVENVISLEQYKTLLDCLDRDGEEKTYWMVKFLAMTGARVSEFIQFQRCHLDSEEMTLWTKGKFRRIIIPHNLIEESRGYFSGQPDNCWLFPNRYGNQMTTRGVSAQIAKCEKYGIPKKVLHPHSFRHLYAIQFLKKNGNIALLADLMGHESVDTTSIYLRLSAEEQKRQFNESMRW